MAENSKIEWTDHTFNPWIGCTKVSPACDHCYAEGLATARLGVQWGPHAQRRLTADSTWKQPLAWNRKAEKAGKRASVFCASLADWADNAAPEGARDRLAELIRKTPWLDWLLLTKRVGNAADMLFEMFFGPAPTNVMVGATIANQAEADRDIPKLLAVKERHGVRVFLSMEPLLGPVQISEYMPNPLWNDIPSWAQAELDWVIAGGESGPKARPSNPDWFRSLRDQCATAGVPFLFKQWGEWKPFLDMTLGEFERQPQRYGFPNGPGMIRVGKKAAGRLLDGVEHNGFPEMAA